MSIQDLLSNQNSESDNIKTAITKYLKAYSKNPKNAIKDKSSISQVIKSWSVNDNNQPEVTNLSKFLSEVELEDGQEYLAGKALQGIRFNSINNGLSQKDRLDIQLRICELFIAAKDVYSGEEMYKQLKKTKDFSNIDGVSDKNQAQFLEMRFKLVDAQYLRLARKHADAGQIYLSYIASPRLAQFPAQRDNMIESAIICMILSSHSPKRASLLANLYENQIVKKHKLFEFVERILFGNIISKQQSNIINNLLTSSQQKITDDGATPLEKAVFQHNIRCLPKLYQDITFNTLNQLLGLEKNSILFFTQLQTMIFDGFPAQIDQVQQIVTFTPNEASEKSYNLRITNYCESLDRFIENVK